ncbi:MAG: hypothetical protein R2816_00150 [Flavobacteriaceae bacterium]|nr:hypothetical protein [Flavobacteriaceae bacterium]
MKHIKFFFIAFSSILFSQNSIEVQFIDKIKPQEDNLIQIDNFKNAYYLGENALVKQTNTSEYIYNNFQLGQLNIVDVFNPLKINLFYRDFNTLVVLDNRLSEIEKINFNLKRPFRNVSHIATAHDNTIWCFNQNTQELELFDYRTNTTKAKTLPIAEDVVQITSNYNTCWVLTKNHLYAYNYFGSLLKKMKNNDYSSLSESNGNIVLKKNNTLFFLKNNSENAISIKLPNLLIKQFFVTNETLYIYDGEFLHQYQLIND